jgi:hypothetical protein
VNDYAGSLTQYYSTRSTDELLFILSTKELTPEAKQSLERELKKRGISESERHITEVRQEQDEFAEQERQRGTPTPRQFLWSIVMWSGIGFCLGSVVELFYGRSLAYEMLLGGVIAFTAGLWMVRRSQTPAR